MPDKVNQSFFEILPPPEHFSRMTEKLPRSNSTKQHFSKNLREWQEGTNEWEHLTNWERNKNKWKNQVIPWSRDWRTGRIWSEFWESILLLRLLVTYEHKSMSSTSLLPSRLLSFMHESYIVAKVWDLPDGEVFPGPSFTSSLPRAQFANKHISSISSSNSFREFIPST